jgi:hypothetical protein
MFSFKQCLFFLLPLLICISCFSQESFDTVQTQPKPLHLSRNKAIIIVGSSIAALGGLNLYMKNSWWYANAKSFHFDDGRDYKYANNLDKMGHFMGSVIVAEAYADAGKWIGMTDKKAAWLGFGMGTGIQAIIETKDGFAPKWGFSVADLTAGTLGSLMPVLRQHSSFFRNTNFKFSYWQRTDRYFKVRNIPTTFFHSDDYINQTYWVSTNLRYLAGQKNTWIPDWLGVSVGWGIEASSWDPNPANERGGKPEFYIAPDIDFIKVFKPKKAFWINTLKTLNYLKFPMPTLQISQKLKFWPIYS